jgi:aminoglycoside phosphotransferase (APT) family kinase protein
MRGGMAVITPIGAGLSGAGVYRVEGAGPTRVLKISKDTEPLVDWRRRLAIHRAAANAGVAPRIIHVDEARRAVVSEFVVDRSFPGFFMNPETRAAAIALLGSTLRRVHDLPVPPGSSPDDGRVLLAETRKRLSGGSAVPSFVLDAIDQVLIDEAPPRDRPTVLSHNDVNPSNLAWDGERLVLVDWDVAGVNDPSYDLATISLFLRMDEQTCLALLSAHDGVTITALPPRFIYNRRLVGVMCGSLFLSMERSNGNARATSDETLESVISLAEFYQRLRAGRLSVASADGQRIFGLALLKASLTPPETAPPMTAAGALRASG